MKKSLLLGSAAALVAVGGAQAADLPVVEPVEYVRVCDAFGAGFHYIPGTETCLKFSGRVRVQAIVGDDDDDDDKDDSTQLTSNFELVTNASSMTEVGMVVGQFAISASNEGDVALGDAWITIGENILVGRETSRFDFGGGYGIYEGLYVDEALNQFTFIMPFGNGVSLTLGLEDNRDRRGDVEYRSWRDGAGNVVSTSAVTSPGTIYAGSSTGDTTVVNLTVTGDDINIVGWSSGSDSNQGGMEIPDIVASLRISQGWGSAQISGAMHQLRIMDRATSGGSVVTGSAGSASMELDDEWGYAVQAGVEVNVGTGSSVKVVAGYADGALHYIGGSAFADAYVDVLFTTGGSKDGASIDTNTGWYVLAAATTGLGDGLTGSVTGSYHDFDDQAELWQIGATLEYEVVENLLVSIAGNYTSTEYEDGYKNYIASPVTGTGTATRAGGTLAGSHPDDTGAWEALLRVQRNF